MSDKNNKLTNRIKNNCPVWSLRLYGAFAVALAVYAAALLSPAIADFIGRFVGTPLRFLLANLTGWLPFSLAETILMSIPLIFTVLIIRSARLPDGRSTKRYLSGLASVVTLFATLFILTFGTAYKGTSLDERLSLDRQPVSADELYETALILLEKTKAELGEVKFSFRSGASVMPYDFSEMNRKLNAAYRTAAEKYSYPVHFYSRVKQVLLSEPMTYLHISGVYTYYTGEANVNRCFPDYSLPYTAAHEMSHQRGVAREDEANFMSFLVCIGSDDPYIRYSGYMNLYEYVLTALYEADAARYREIITATDGRIKSEINSYNSFFEKYRDSRASEVSGAINDLFLKAQGQQAGTKSYGLVVDLACAYYRSGAVSG